MNGRLTDVIIEEFSAPNRLGLDTFIHLIVWADEGNKELIKSVEGVSAVYNSVCATEFHVYLDHRYDREYVKAEIEAVIKIALLENEELDFIESLGLK